MAGGGDSKRAILFALGANFAIAVAKGIAAFVTGSTAMLAETVHSVADCGNQLLLLLGLKQSHDAPNENYQLGSGKAVYFWSFLVAVMLFTVGGIYSLYEGFHKLSDPQPLTQWWWAAGVLAFAIAAEAVSMRACMLEVSKSRGNRTIWQWFRESRQAELIVIFGEDLAALLGLIFALFAVLMSVFTGNPIWDAIGTLMIGALLILVAVFVAREVKEMLIGQSMDPQRQEELKNFVSSYPTVERLISMRTMQMGNEVLLAVQAHMHDTPTVAELVSNINDLEKAVKQNFPEVRWSFFEPEVDRA